MLRIHTAAPETGSAPSGSTPTVFEDLGLFEGWDRDYYHPAAIPFYDRAIKRMLRELQCPPNAPILDAGCGPGEHSIRVAREGYHVCAIDVSETVLDEAHRRAAAAGVADRISFQQADLTHLDLDDQSFDAIFCWGVVIHIRSIKKALDELVRILKPNGRLALYVTNAAAWDHTVLKWGRLLLGKTPAPLVTLRMGRGRWHGTGPDRLWVWHINVPALTHYLERRGMTRVSRIAGEFTETQRRTRGLLRLSLLWLNRAYSYARLPAFPCADNLLIFQKHS